MNRTTVPQRVNWWQFKAIQLADDRLRVREYINYDIDVMK